MTRTSGRFVRLALVAALAGAGTLLGSADASATKRPVDASIRAAHFSPTTPGVDVYLGRFAGGKAPMKLWLSRVRYGSVTGYQPLTPGLYTVAMRLSGSAPTSRPMLTWTLDAKPDAAYTVAGVGAGSAVRGVVVKDDLSVPPAGDGRVRVIQAASRAPIAVVTASDGKVISRGVPFATVSRYATLPAGRWRVKAVATAASSTASTTPAVASGPVTVRNGQITSILLLDGKSSGITLRTVLDSSSSGVMPAGGVPAGGGGTATELTGVPHVDDSAGAIALLVSLLVGGAGALWLAAVRRTRRCVRPAAG